MYAPVISSLKVATYDTEQTINKALNIVNELGQINASLNGFEKLYSKCDRTRELPST